MTKPSTIAPRTPSTIKIFLRMVNSPGRGGVERAARLILEFPAGCVNSLTKLLRHTSPEQCRGARPNGAQVNSQGREPLVRRITERPAPTGAADGVPIFLVPTLCVG